MAPWSGDHCRSSLVPVWVVRSSFSQRAASTGSVRTARGGFGPSLEVCGTTSASVTWPMWHGLRPSDTRHRASVHDSENGGRRAALTPLAPFPLSAWRPPYRLRLMGMLTGVASVLHREIPFRPRPSVASRSGARPRCVEERRESDEGALLLHRGADTAWYRSGPHRHLLHVREASVGRYGSTGGPVERSQCGSGRGGILGNESLRRARPLVTYHPRRSPAASAILHWVCHDHATWRRRDTGSGL